MRALGRHKTTTELQQLVTVVNAHCTDPVEQRIGDVCCLIITYAATSHNPERGSIRSTLAVQQNTPFLRASAMLKHVIDIGWTSVRLSVTRWHCMKMAERIVMISSPHDSPFILVLCIPRSSRNSDGVTPCGGAKYRWGINFARFSTDKSLYLANDRAYKISPWLLWKANRNSYTIYQMVPFPMTLNEP